MAEDEQIHSLYLSQDIHLLLPLDITAPGSQAFGHELGLIPLTPLVSKLPGLEVWTGAYHWLFWTSSLQTADRGASQPLNMIQSLTVNLFLYISQGFQGDSVVKNSSANAEDTGSVPGSGRSPGGGHGSPLQYSCLENPMDRGAWWTTVYRVAQEVDMTQQLNNNKYISYWISFWGTLIYH